MGDKKVRRDIEVSASHRVLIDVLTVLGAYVDRMVIVGGWVPHLVFPDSGHIRSVDVDLALDGRRIQPAAYDTIKDRLIGAGYRLKTPGVTNIFVRDIGDTGQTITVKLDLITGEHSGPASQQPSQHIHGMDVTKLHGIDLALDHTIDVSVSGELPDGGVKEVKARVAAVPTFVCMKAIAMNERKKPKDAYDILFCLQHYKNGSVGLAQALNELRGCALVEEAIESLKVNFRAIDSVGPVWVGQILAEQGEDEAFAVRDAHERVQLLLRSLSMPKE